MVFHGFGWFSWFFKVVLNGFWLVSMVFQGCFMVFHGFWLVSMVIAWFPWFFKVVSWFWVGFHGFSRFPGGFSLSLMVPG